MRSKDHPCGVGTERDVELEAALKMSVMSILAKPSKESIQETFDAETTDLLNKLIPIDVRTSRKLRHTQFTRRYHKDGIVVKRKLRCALISSKYEKLFQVFLDFGDSL